MPGLVSNVSDHSTWPRLRLCTIAKHSSDEEYGFNLHSERGKGQFIGDVDDNSPASRGGLKKGDRIIAVNGELAVMDSHAQIVQKIKADKMQCEMLVVDDSGYQWFMTNDIPLSTDLPNIDTVDHTNPTKSPYSESKQGESAVDVPKQPNWTAPEQKKAMQPAEPSVFISSTTRQHASPFGTAKSKEINRTPRPLLCVLMKQSASDEFGFNLHAEKNKGHFIGHVDEKSIAHRAGLVLGQRIVGVNGTLIFPDTMHQSVVKLIKSDPLKTELLVATESVDEYFKVNNQEFSFDNCDTYSPNSPPPAYVTLEQRESSQSEEPIVFKTDRAKSNQSKTNSEVHDVPRVTAVAVSPTKSDRSSSKNSDRSSTYHATTTMHQQHQSSIDETAHGKYAPYTVEVPTNNTANGYGYHNGHQSSNSRSSSEIENKPTAVSRDAFMSMSAAEFREKLASKSNRRRKDHGGALSLEEKLRIVENL